jgi:hypothetical protein
MEKRIRIKMGRGDDRSVTIFAGIDTRKRHARIVPTYLALFFRLRSRFWITEMEPLSIFSAEALLAILLDILARMNRFCQNLGMNR